MDVRTLRENLGFEIAQREQTGQQVSGFREQWDAGLEDAQLAAVYEALSALAPSPDPAHEPSEEAAIAALWRPDPLPVTSSDHLADQLLGAWRGRVVGNMLGKPVEQGDYWTRARLRDYAEQTGAWPLRNYFPAPEGVRDRWELKPDAWADSTLGRIDGSARDDDVDYTILGLHVLETYGRGFTSGDVADQWLLRLPFHQTYTAERAAYANLVNGLRPPATATVDNPYREWIGALIRADIFGYVNPGDPRAAAALAYRDAVVSHVGNGIHGEQWAAALVASAFTARSARQALDRSRCYVPEGSRTAKALDAVVELHDAGATWEQTLADADQRWRGYSWVHTVNNVAVIAAALLYGQDDFSQTIALTVLGGLDTDSNGATAGSVMGILGGTAGIAEHWTDPLHDRVRSAVQGFDGISITELARRTLAVATA